MRMMGSFTTESAENTEDTEGTIFIPQISGLFVFSVVRFDRTALIQQLFYLRDGPGGGW
jgi:hypothetical protein